MASASAAAALPAGDAPSHIALPTRRHALLTVAVMMAMIMQILDTTIANVALPHMQASLGATIDSVTWVLTSYIVASAIAFPLTGWLSERFGSRNLFLTAVAGFVLASMLCGISTSLSEMVLFRVFQGVFAAFIGPLSQTVMLDINPQERHGKAMSVWGMGIMVGPILGPIIGGWLTENYDWRWIFYVNLPIGAVTFAMLWALLPSQPLKRRGFDLFGFSMLALALASVQLMLDRGQQLDWFQSPEIWIEAGIAAAGFWVFAVHIATGRNALFEPQLFANRNFATSLFLIFIVGIVMFATMALLPPMLQTIYGYPVIDAGLLVAPRGIGILVSMFIAGQLIGKVDPRWLIGAGMILATYSLYLMTGWALDMGARPIIVSGLVQGLGVGLVFVPLNVTAFGTLPPHLRTDGAAMLNLSRSIGASVGISLTSTFLARNLQTSHADLSTNVTAFTSSAVNLQSYGLLGRYGDAALRSVDAEINRQALMIGYLDDYYLMMIVTAVSLPLLLLLRRPQPPKPGDPPVIAE